MNKSRLILLAASLVAIIVSVALWWMLSKSASRVENDAHVSAAAGSASSGLSPIAQTGAQGTLPSVTTDPSSRAPGVEEPPAIESPDLRGIVVLAHDEPVAGALVEVREMPGRDTSFQDIEYKRASHTVATGKSDDKGEFALRFSALHSCDLFVRAEGFAPARVLDVKLGTYVRVQLDSAAAMTGRVIRLEDDSPIGGARILEMRGLSAMTLSETASNAGGSYRLANLAPGSARFMVLTPGGGSLSAEQDLAPGGVVVRDFAVPQKPVVSGVVIDATTKVPIRGAEVGVHMSVWRNTVITDVEGRYSLVLERWGIPPPIGAHAAGYSEIVKFVRLATEDSTLDFELSPGRSVRGRILGEQGEGVSDAYVAAVARIQAQGGGAVWDWLSATSGRDGVFEIADLRADLRHALIVHKEGLGTSSVQFPVSELETTAVDLGDIRLRRSATVEGILSTDEDTPVAGASIAVSPAPDQEDSLHASNRPSNRAFLTPRGIMTDEQGRFRFADLARGKWRIEAWVRGHTRPADVEVDLAAGETRSDVRLVMAVGLAIEGRVIDSDGDPVRGAWVQALREPVYGMPAASAQSGENGVFVISGLPPGQYEVRAELNRNYISRTGTIQLAPQQVAHIDAGTKDVIVSLARIVWVSGVVQEESGEPVAKAYVTIGGAKGTVLDMAAICDASGRFGIRAVEGAIIDIQALRSAPDVNTANGLNLGVSPGTGASLTGVVAGNTPVVVRFPK